MGIRLTKNFMLHEFACRDKYRTPVPDNLISNVIELAGNLQILRDKLNCPIHINSAYRTPEHNQAVGGAHKIVNGERVETSQHCDARAADITARDYTPDEVAKVIEVLIAAGKMKEGGIGRYKGFVHYDIRGYKARW